MLVTLSARFGRRVRVTTTGTHARAVSSATASTPSPVDLRTRATFYDPAVEASLTHRQRQVFAKPSDAPPLPAVADHGYQYGVTPAEVEGRGACVARALSTRTAGVQGALKFRRRQLCLKYRDSEWDTGSSRVQVAMLSLRLERLSLHATSHNHDKHCKRQIAILAARRKTLLSYMMRKDFSNYVRVCGRGEG